MASTASDRKGTKIQNDISRFYANIFSFQNIKIKLNLRTNIPFNFHFFEKKNVFGRIIKITLNFSTFSVGGC